MREIEHPAQDTTVATECSPQHTTTAADRLSQDTTEAEEIKFPDDAPEETFEETMFESPLELHKGVEFAPGEGEIPLSILLDEYCEELAFPSIYCGIPRKTNPAAKLSYEDISNSEIRRRDRRAVRSDHLFFVNKKSQCKQLNSSINIALKKTQLSGMTAAQAMDKTFINDAVSKDSAFRFMANITGSPAYWEHQKKNVLAMVRQLGIFTFFITLSAAETHWPELLKILKKTVDNEDDADVSNLEFLEKARLIRSDPVTCALYFDHRFKELKKTWNKVKNGPFGDHRILHIYYRIEFQHRGSPHVHMVVWLENAPIYNPNDESTHQAVIDFIGNIISTTSINPIVEDVQTFQYHKCTFTCKKYAKGTAKCRFNAPFAPMDKTRIIKPLPSDFVMTKEKAEEIKDLNKRLSALLSGDSLSSINNFQEMLNILNCTVDEYLFAISSQLSATKVFMKREPKDCRINQYSPKILSLMRSNMDIQFVLDPYACVSYIVDYINKSSRGLSRLLRQCVLDFKKGNFSLRQRLKALANTFYNGTEVSAQEASWCRLRLPMSSTSVAVEFINTLPKKDRQRMLKSDEELQQLDAQSEDIAKHGVIDRYADRADELNNLCLAEFVSDYTHIGKGFRSDEMDLIQEDHVVEEDDGNKPETSSSNKYKMKTGKGYVYKRRQRRIIRFCRFDVQKDPEDFFRELVMLFMPWRDEKTEVEDPNSEEIYKQHKESIEAKYRLYTAVEIDFNAILLELEKQREVGLQREEEQTNEETDPSMACYDFDANNIKPNIMIDIGLEGSGTSVGVKAFTIPDHLPDKEYFEICDSLNLEQRDYLMHVVNLMKLKSKPFYHFISGGAGVGKSRLIKAIYQSIIRIYRQIPGPVDTTEVILVAPTGKAAHNIGGMTAHSAFSLVTTQNQSTMKDLTAEPLNTMRVKLYNMKLLIIDEISMLGNYQLNCLHRRMSQTFCSNKPFGGMPVIVFGDFNQLRPVGDGYPFLPLKKPLAELVGSFLWQNFELFELTKIMRQKDDLTFAEALGRLALGELTEEDIKMFKKRCFEDDKSLPDEAKNAINLFKTKIEVEAYNKKRMKQLLMPDTPNCKFNAKDQLIGSANPRDAAQAWFALAGLKTEDTYGLPHQLHLQVGIRYMITLNINIADGLFNGASGILKFIEMSQTKGPQAVWIQFDDPTVGATARADRKDLAQTLVLAANVTPITRATKVFKPTKSGQAQIKRNQYPLVVAEGITIHKSQGQTMIRVVVGLSKSMDRSLLYVALSRATALSGLFMIGEFKAPHKPPDNHPPKVEMTRMRQYARFTPKFKWMQKVNENVIQIISHNVQSLRKNINSIICDPVYTNSHLLLFQETWILAQDQLDVPGFKEVQRNYFSGRRTANGTIIFAKNSCDVVAAESTTTTSSEDQHIEITSCTINDIRVINIYKNPKSTMEFFIETLREMKETFDHANVLLCGDFNTNFAKPNEVEPFLSNEFGLTMPAILSEKIYSTTNENTFIDTVFAKLEKFNIRVDIYETLFSYHKPLIIRLYKK